MLDPWTNSDCRNWPTITGNGWLPVGISERYSTVRWVEFGSNTLDQPFFEWTVKALRENNPLPNEYESDISTLIACGQSEEAFVPAGFILHASRCGSTLLLNALGLAEDVLALGEAQPMARSLALAGAHSRRISRTGETTARALVNLYASHRSVHPRRLVVKLDIFGMLRMNVIRKIWPDVPCVILVRDPAEIVVSNLSSPPAWFRCLNYSSVFPFGMPPSDVGSPQRFCAWAIGRLLSEVYIHLDDNCAILDYKDLNPSAVQSIADHFALRYPKGSKERLDAVFRFHAKDSTKVFADDTLRKRSALTESLSKSIETWAFEPYARLRAVESNGGKNVPAARPREDGID